MLAELDSQLSPWPVVLFLYGEPHSAGSMKSQEGLIAGKEVQPRYDTMGGRNSG